ncbi:putative pectate lyase 21 [Nymphaea thermarum]|nr:putative pectate lyase 21 [Nymphaea thermarum]
MAALTNYVLTLVTVFSLLFCQPVYGGGCEEEVIKDRVARNLRRTEALLLRHSAREAHDGRSTCLSAAIDHAREAQRLALPSRYEEALSSVGRLMDCVCFQIEQNASIGAPPPGRALGDSFNQACDQARLSFIAIRNLLVHCNPHTATSWSRCGGEGQDHSSSPHLPRKKLKQVGSCVADGTKCQFLPCARLRKLPRCAVGFASSVTGGAAGPYFTVTDPRDDPLSPRPGTLRHAIEAAGKSPGGGWIRFGRGMTVVLEDRVWIGSNTTIDGRQTNVTIVHKGLVLYGLENVILVNIKVVTTGASDTIHIFQGARRVWIDHVTIEEGGLGLVTVAEGSTDVTVSNCYLKDRKFSMLLGASDLDDSDKILRVTVYRNWFDSSGERMPHCRQDQYQYIATVISSSHLLSAILPTQNIMWGYCHVANNYYEGWKYYAIGGRKYAEILSEANVFEPGIRQEVTPWFEQFKDDLTPTIQSSDDLLLNNATFHQFLHNRTLEEPKRKFWNYHLPMAPTHALINLVKACSGALRGEILEKCLHLP